MSQNRYSEPLISIVTVVYNASESIGQTILSIIKQKFNNIEYIIIDGGSTDGTLDIILKYKEEFTKNGIILKLISEPDEGIYDAMNKGVRLASGDWIYFLGADDCLLSDFSNIIYHLFDKHTIYYGNVIFVTSKRIYDGYFSAYKLMLRNISHQAIFYPRVVFEKYCYDLKYKLFADYNLNMLCWGDKELQFKYIAVLIAQYNDNGRSSTHLDDAFNQDKPYIIKANFNLFYYTIILIRSFLVSFFKLKRLKDYLNE